MNNESLTVMEMDILKCMAEDNGNGENILRNGFGEYVSLALDNILNEYNMKQLRGGISSLVKKGYVEIHEDEEDNVINYTEAGKAFIINYLNSNQKEDIFKKYGFKEVETGYAKDIYNNNIKITFNIISNNNEWICEVLTNDTKPNRWAYMESKESALDEIIFGYGYLFE
jgi:DNA-binding MarR family transcriptional regulator